MGPRGPERAATDRGARADRRATTRHPMLRPGSGKPSPCSGGESPPRCRCRSHGCATACRRGLRARPRCGPIRSKRWPRACLARLPRGMRTVRTNTSAEGRRSNPVGAVRRDQGSRACDDAADVAIRAGNFEADGGAGLMKNISIVGRASTFFVVTFGLFGVGGLAIGVLLVAGAGKVAAAVHGATAARIGVAGAGVSAISLAIGGWTWRQLSAVCAFELADDGTWTLITRRGKRSSVRPARVSLALRGFIVWLFWSALPRRINVCTGAVVLDDLREPIPP